MPRRPSRPKTELSESWGQVSDDDILSEGSTFSGSESDDQATPMPKSVPRVSSQTPRASPRTSSSRYSNSPRQRVTRSSVEPELVMPSLRHDSAEPYTYNGSPKRSPRAAGKKTTPKRVKYGERSEPSVHSKDATSWLDVVWSMLSPLSFGVWAWLQPFFSFVIAAFILIFLVYLGKSYIGPLFFNPFSSLAVGSSLCNWPILSSLPFCPSTPYTKGHPEFDELVTVQTSFEDLLSSASDYSFLPVQMKHSEASMRDLKHLVKYSKLPSRNELVFEFEGFTEAARQAGFDLGRFSSSIGGAVDHVMSINRWTYQVIEGAADRQASRGSISRFVKDTVPALFGWQPASIDDLVLSQYLRHTAAVEERIHRLIIEAQALLMILQNIDDRLDVIASITTRDGVKLSDSKEELLSSLWTYLGGNRNDVRKLEDQLKLLGDVVAYRKTASGYVNKALMQLLAIQGSLEDLRERVAAPEVLAGSAANVPLEVHLENVRMGLERLERIRNDQRRTDDAKFRNFLDQTAFGDDRLVEGKVAGAKVIG